MKALYAAYSLRRIFSGPRGGAKEGHASLTMRHAVPLNASPPLPGQDGPPSDDSMDDVEEEDEEEEEDEDEDGEEREEVII